MFVPTLWATVVGADVELCGLFGVPPVQGLHGHGRRGESRVAAHVQEVHGILPTGAGESLWVPVLCSGVMFTWRVTP